MKVEKHELRDFVRILDNPSNTPVTITRPRDESFPANIVNQAFSVYRDAERQFLLDLEHDTVRNLYPQGPEPKCHAVAHLRHHVELLLTLKGMKPCVPFVSPKPTGIATMDNMVLRCLVPLMEQFDLESYGFKLYCKSPLGHENHSYLFRPARCKRGPLGHLLHPHISSLYSGPKG